MSSHIVPEPDEDSPPPVAKGRRNAIVTYETLAQIANTLAAVFTKVEGIEEKVGTQAKQHADHEARIRSLEMTIATMAAVSTAAKDHTKWLLPLMVSATSLLLAALTIFLNHK